MINEERLKRIRSKLSKYPEFELIGEGNRGVVYRLDNNTVVKIEHDHIKSRIENEFNLLKRLSKYKYFPKPIYYDKEDRFLIREYVKGIEIDKVKLNWKQIKEIVEMCFILDKEGINQKELTRPFKHIFIDKDKVMMIDFERSTLSNNTKNVNQFVQFLIKRYRIKDKSLIELLKEYKKSKTRKDLNKILSLLSKLDIVH